MYSVITIADEILRLAKRHGKMLTPLQLMKLTYIAHGWHLAIRGTPLFKESVQAWKYGPVIPDLYHATKEYGSAAIPWERVNLDTPAPLDVDTHAFLADVFEKYGNLTGIQLSNLTHKTGTPWSKVYEKGVFGIDIPVDLIKSHYLGLLNERNQGPAA